MTNEQYQELLKWCRDKRNHATDEFRRRYEIKEQAISIRRKIADLKKDIKEQMWWLEQTTVDMDKRARIIARIDSVKDQKRVAMKQFDTLCPF